MAGSVDGQKWNRSAASGVGPLTDSLTSLTAPAIAVPVHLRLSYFIAFAATTHRRLGHVSCAFIAHYQRCPSNCVFYACCRVLHISGMRYVGMVAIRPDINIARSSIPDSIAANTHRNKPQDVWYASKTSYNDEVNRRRHCWSWHVAAYDRYSLADVSTT